MSENDKTKLEVVDNVDDFDIEYVTVPAEHGEYLKYMFDGVSTMADLAERLHSVSQYFMELASQDATLSHPVDGGHIHYTIPGHDIDVEMAVLPNGDVEPIDEMDLFHCPKCLYCSQCGDELDKKNIKN